MRKIFNENGQEIGIYDICLWWIEKYPKDVFISEPKTVVIIREQMEIILKEANYGNKPSGGCPHSGG